MPATLPHDADGVVLDIPRAKRGRRERTPDEQAERDRVLAERAELRRVELAALRSTDPACETDDDPPVTWRRPARIGGEPSGILLDLPRVSGRGLPGSRLVLAAREYDGAGPNGGDAREYATAFVMFRDRAGNLRRTVGAAIRREELRAVGAALIELADEYDARAPMEKP